jgi:hypothetical protein
MARPLSLITTKLKEILSRNYTSNPRAGMNEIIILEGSLKQALGYIEDLEKDAEHALKIENIKRQNALERIIEDNNTLYLRKEQKFLKIMSDLRRRLEEAYAKIPQEERMKQEFTCFICELPWDREFLRMTDKKGNNYCVSCMDEGVEKAGKDIGQEIILEATPMSKAVKSFVCEFCGTQGLGKPIKTHIINAPDGRSSRRIIKICKECSLNRARKDTNIIYCPRRTAPRDSYDTSLPEWDCDCPPKEKYEAVWIK